MLIQSVTAYTYGESFQKENSFPLDRSPKAHGRFSKLLQDTVEDPKQPSRMGPFIPSEVPGLEVIRPK